MAHRVLQLVVRQECGRKRGVPIDASEEHLRIRLEAMQSQLHAPTQYTVSGAQQYAPTQYTVSGAQQHAPSRTWLVVHSCCPHSVHCEWCIAVAPTQCMVSGAQLLPPYSAW